MVFTDMLVPAVLLLFRLLVLHTFYRILIYGLVNLDKVYKKNTCEVHNNGNFLVHFCVAAHHFRMNLLHGPHITKPQFCCSPAGGMDHYAKLCRRHSKKRLQHKMLEKVRHDEQAN